MRKISQQELERFGKKKGFKIKRKAGARKKKPESEVKDEVALSGAKTPETVVPAPASNELVPLLAKMTEVLERIAPDTEPKLAPEPVVRRSVLPPMPVKEKPKPAAVKTVAPIVVPVRALKQVWSYAVERNDKGNMGEVIATSQTGRKIVCTMMREKGIIEQIEISEGSEVKRILEVQRTDGLIEGVQG